MTFRSWVGVVALAGCAVVAPAGAATQDQSPQSRAASERMERLQAHIARLPQRMQSRMSARLSALTTRWNRLSSRLRRPQPAAEKATRPTVTVTAAPVTPALTGGKVNDPRLDGTLSAIGGFTQNQTSTAWCGTNVVVAYRDSGSADETSANASSGISNVGISRSVNRGSSFTDVGVLNPGADFFNLLVGDPVVGCSDANTFRAADLFESSPDAGTTFQLGMSLSTSTDGGQTWGDPVVAASITEDGDHFLDRGWLAIDPANGNNIYLTYTEFDFSGALCGTTTSGSPTFGGAIQLVGSTDGGATWGTPVQVQNSCGSSELFVTPQVAFGPTGEIYVAWEDLSDSSPTNQIQVAKSTDAGQSFGSFVLAGSVTPVGTFDSSVGSQILQPDFAVDDHPSLAVDRSTGPTSGYVYVAWNDGRNNLVVDQASDTGTYGFGDVLLARSTDGGATFSRTPVRVNVNTPEPAVAFSNGTDQWSPAIAVDPKGNVGACWYDKRMDANNFMIDRYCGKSIPGGTKWVNYRKSTASFPALTDQDDAVVNSLTSFISSITLPIGGVDMGLYDSLATDATKTYTGFKGAYGDNTLGNPDVKLVTPF